MYNKILLFRDNWMLYITIFNLEFLFVKFKCWKYTLLLHIFDCTEGGFEAGH